jgi:hypothetical protein
MDLFAPVDAMNASNFLREVVQPDGSAVLNFLMPVTGFDYQGQSTTPGGYGKDYDLYLTINATHPAGQGGQVGGIFSSLNVTLWADPLSNDGSPSVSSTSDPSFAHGSANDIVLATGTMVSASVTQDADGTKHADDVVSMTPTLAGTLLLGGSIKSGTEMAINTTTPPDDFFTYTNQPGGTTVDVVDNGTATITLDPESTILLPNLPTDLLHLPSLRFIHGTS